jgi:hypothetical protein
MDEYFDSTLISSNGERNFIFLNEEIYRAELKICFSPYTLLVQRGYYSRPVFD